MVKPAVLFFFFILFFISGWMLNSSVSNIKGSVQLQAMENQKLSEEGKTIIALKDKWESKVQLKQTIKKLRTFPKLTINTKRGSRYALQYSQLNPDELNKLTNELFNSSCIIKVYELKRIDVSHATVYVEIES